MAFSRGRKSGGGAREAGRHAARSRDYGYVPEEPERPEIPVPEFGPYDVAVAPYDDLQRIDLGALKVPNIPGTSLQVEASPNGQIVRVQLEHQGSRLQLGAFAAPRSAGIWDEVREELRTALLSGGAKVVEVDGEYGPQLAARFTGGGGNAGVMEVRHVGIDGPRWFLHAVFVGPAAVDPDRSSPLHQVLRGLVVDRGAEARPVKEALPLRLPPEYAERLAEMAAKRQPAGAAPATGAAAGRRPAASP